MVWSEEYNVVRQGRVLPPLLFTLYMHRLIKEVEGERNESPLVLEIKNTITKYNLLSILYPLLKENNIPLECKKINYVSKLKPILTYNSEAWELDTK